MKPGEVPDIESFQSLGACATCVAMPTAGPEGDRRVLKRASLPGSSAVILLAGLDRRAMTDRYAPDTGSADWRLEMGLAIAENVQKLV